MIHDTTKQLAHFERTDHRITGDRLLVCSRGTGSAKANFAIDEAKPLAYVVVQPDE